jgi:hypothetical protein
MSEHLSGTYAGVIADPAPSKELVTKACGDEKLFQTNAIIYRVERFQLLRSSAWHSDSDHDPRNGVVECKNNSDQDRTLNVRAKLYDKVADKALTVASVHWPSGRQAGPACAVKNVLEADARIGAKGYGGALRIFGGDLNISDLTRSGKYRNWYDYANGDIGAHRHNYRDAIFDDCTERAGGVKKCLRGNWTFNHEGPGKTRRIDFLFAQTGNGKRPKVGAEATVTFDAADEAGNHVTGSDNKLNYSEHRAIRARVHYDSGGIGGSPSTRLTYTGPTRASYHQRFTASAKLTASRKPGAEPTQPVPDVPVSFTFGQGGYAQTCTGTTDSAGVARCALTVTQAGGKTTLVVRFNGDQYGYASTSTFVPFTILRRATEVAYTGPERVANGTAARLAGVLREKGGGPIEGRKLRLSLGSGINQQVCTGTTNSSGTARCTIQSVDQPLNDAATVPVQVRFAGDPYYLPSSKSATVLLEYYTGRAYGLTGKVGLPLVPLVEVSPTPDTGPVRTARAFAPTTPCFAEVEAGALLTTGVVCPKVTTTLAPGTSTSTTTVERTRIGLPGLPVIDVRGATARSTSTCGSGGSAAGSTDIELYVGGRRVPTTTEVNVEIDLPGVARLVVNEQKPVAKADHGLTVNALHLTAAGGETDIVVASATSDVHNCAS